MARFLNALTQRYAPPSPGGRGKLGKRVSLAARKSGPSQHFSPLPPGEGGPQRRVRVCQRGAIPNALTRRYAPTSPGGRGKPGLKVSLAEGKREPRQRFSPLPPGEGGPQGRVRDCQHRAIPNALTRRYAPTSPGGRGKPSLRVSLAEGKREPSQRFSPLPPGEGGPQGRVRACQRGAIPKHPHAALRADLSRRERQAKPEGQPRCKKSEPSQRFNPLPPVKGGPQGRVRDCQHRAIPKRPHPALRADLSRRERQTRPEGQPR
ncbi:hypothetical protein SAMN04488068_1212 [Hydrocarboniphaga daqingensis]|uniref:Uncharacterized protein n=1 Tax=Hydrocarboniphaga daqingensis TaxID=490188 RepID=A0A1M5M1K6_9GAMM|nr:hypothetical protein SAMN04488068_1212 [Hydrocarboniphaga daqingensis]